MGEFLAVSISLSKWQYESVARGTCIESIKIFNFLFFPSRKAVAKLINAVSSAFLADIRGGRALASMTPSRRTTAYFACQVLISTKLLFPANHSSQGCQEAHLEDQTCWSKFVLRSLCLCAQSCLTLQPHGL